MAKVIVITKSCGRNTLTIPSSGLIIGRHESSDIRLNNNSVALRHALLTFHEGNFHLGDLDSFIGIKINERLVEKVRLEAGNLLTIGNYQFRTAIGTDQLILEEISESPDSFVSAGNREEMGGLPQDQEPIARGLFPSFFAVIFTPSRFFSTLNTKNGPAMPFMFSWLVFSFCGFFRIADFNWLSFFKDASLLVGAPIFFGFTLTLTVGWQLIGHTILYFISLLGGINVKGINLFIVAFASAPFLFSVNFRFLLFSYCYANILLVIGSVRTSRISYLRAITVVVILNGALVLSLFTGGHLPP